MSVISHVITAGFTWGSQGRQELPRTLNGLFFLADHFQQISSQSLNADSIMKVVERSLNGPFQQKPLQAVVFFATCACTMVVESVKIY